MPGASCTGRRGSPPPGTADRSWSRRRRGRSSTAELTELGEHRLKDFAEPVALFQLGQERFPPLKTISNTNLPRPASSFVGRARERDELVDLLRNGTRLVTLSGPGGSGKTRLAVEAASELVPAFTAGVFWVGLAALRDPALVTETIAQTLGAKDGLAEHIGERELLLLLDNFEQVVEAAPELGPAARALPEPEAPRHEPRAAARSRGEVEYPVPPLAEPEAVELFCERSRLEPDETIAELCRRLDDLPLALELAAARTSVLSPGPDPRAPLPAARPAQGRTRRRAAPADAAGDDRVEPRPARRRGAAPVRPPRRLPRRLHARGGRSRSPTPTSTRSSRSSTRAWSATRTSASGCWRRSASTRASASPQSGEEASSRRRHALYVLDFAEAAHASWTMAAIQAASTRSHRQPSTTTCGRRSSGRATRARTRRCSASPRRSGSTGDSRLLPRSRHVAAARARARIVAGRGADGRAPGRDTSARTQGDYARRTSWSRNGARLAEQAGDEKQAAQGDELGGSDAPRSGAISTAPGAVRRDQGAGADDRRLTIGALRPPSTSARLPCASGDFRRRPSNYAMDAVELLSRARGRTAASRRAGDLRLERPRPLRSRARRGLFREMLGRRRPLSEGCADRRRSSRARRRPRCRHEEERGAQLLRAAAASFAKSSGSTSTTTTSSGVTSGGRGREGGARRGGVRGRPGRAARR